MISLLQNKINKDVNVLVPTDRFIYFFTFIFLMVTFYLKVLSKQMRNIPTQVFSQKPDNVTMPKFHRALLFIHSSLFIKKYFSSLCFLERVKVISLYLFISRFFYLVTFGGGFSLQPLEISFFLSFFCLFVLGCKNHICLQYVTI